MGDCRHYSYNKYIKENAYDSSLKEEPEETTQMFSGEEVDDEAQPNHVLQNNEGITVSGTLLVQFLLCPENRICSVPSHTWLRNSFTASIVHS